MAAYNVPALFHALRNKNVSEQQQQLDTSGASTYPPTGHGGLIPNSGVSHMPLEGIHAPHPHDVLAGRGKSINHHPGNQYFISLIKPLKTDYVATPKQEKSMFARMVIQKIKNLKPPGRFLKQDPNTGLWFDIGEKKAILKTRQALREGAPEIEKLLKNGQIVAKMKDSMDPLSVKRALDKIVKPNELTVEPSAMKVHNSPLREPDDVGHVVDSISFDRKYPDEVPDNEAQLLINFAADSSNALGALRKGETPPKGTDDVPVSTTENNKGRANATMDEAMLLANLPNSSERRTSRATLQVPMPPLTSKGKSNISSHRRVSFKAAPQDSPSRNESGSNTITNGDVARTSDGPGTNRRVSFKAQENIPQNVAIMSKFGGMDTTDGSSNRRVSYKFNEEIDKVGGSKDGSSGANNADGNLSRSENRNHRRSFTVGNRSSFSMMPQLSQDDNTPSRRASYLELDAIRRASVTSQDLMMIQQRYQNDLVSGGNNMIHPGLAAAQNLGIGMAGMGGPQGFQDGNDMGGYGNRRVSFMSQQDLDLARRSSIASIQSIQNMQNIQNMLGGYADVGVGPQSAAMSGLPFLPQQIDGRRGSFLAQELLLQNQLMMQQQQQQGNGLTKDNLENRRMSFQAQAAQNLGSALTKNSSNKKVGGSSGSGSGSAGSSDITFPPKREGQEAVIEGSVMIPGVGNRRIKMTAEQFNALQAAQGDSTDEIPTKN